MKNQLLALTAAIGVMITGGIMPTLILLPPAQAVTAVKRNGILVIGVGKNVRGNKSIAVPQGTKFYFECKEAGSAYDYIEISGSAKTVLATSTGSRTDIYSFPNKGRYSFNITNIDKSYNDSISVIVK